MREDSFRRILEQTPVGISHHAPDGRWLLANECWCRMLGYRPDELTALRLEQIIHADHRAIVLEQIRRLLESEGAAFEQEVCCLRRDGAELWVALHVGLARDEADRPDCLVAVIEDVSERRRGEAMLATLEQRLSAMAAERDTAQAALREAERLAALGSLAAGLCHDLANLVAPIRMGTALLEGAAHLDEQGRAALRIVQRCGGALMELADGMRLLVQGDTDATAQSVELADWWRQARPLLQAALPAGVALHGEFDEQLPAVTANAGGLTRAVLNLVTNAGEAIAAAGDGGRVVVWAGSNGDGSGVVLGVRDDGPGMPLPVRERMFEPFFTTKSWTQASGLGLASVKSFATDCGGSIAVDSEPGQGTNVVLTLPRRHG